MSHAPLSPMLASAFRISKGALGLTSKQLAAKLGVKPPTISGYEARGRVPVHIAAKLEYLLLDHHRWLAAQPGVMLQHTVDIHNMLAQQNFLETQQLLRGLRQSASRHGTLRNRRATPSTMHYPPYRLTHDECVLYALALSRWQTEVLSMQARFQGTFQQEDYRIERAVLKHLASTLPRHAPHDIHLRHSDWPTVSSALLHLNKVPAFQKKAATLRSHWHRHKGSGFPFNRSNNKR